MVDVNGHQITIRIEEARFISQSAKWTEDDIGATSLYRVGRISTRGTDDYVIKAVPIDIADTTDRLAHVFAVDCRLNGKAIASI